MAVFLQREDTPSHTPSYMQAELRSISRPQHDDVIARVAPRWESAVASAVDRVPVLRYRTAP